MRGLRRLIAGAEGGRPRLVSLDAEAMIRGFIDRVNADRNAEVERLRDALRKAIAVLQAAVGRPS